MLERFIIAAAAEDPGRETAAQTRERLQAFFPRGATRRMTQLGLMIGSVLRDVALAEDDAVVYASTFAENQALEAYLASFPTPSPTLFQTSIHPSGLQQVLIARQQPVREVLPVTGREQLGARALELALTSPAARVVVCGGEERGSWLLEVGAASEVTFAVSLVLDHSAAGALGRVWLDSDAGEDKAFSLRDLHDLVSARRGARRRLGPQLSLGIEWQ